MIKGADAADHPAVTSRDREELDKLLMELERAPQWRPKALGGIFTAEELMAEDLPPVRWVVPGILPEGVTLLAGKPKVGKSWLALAMGIAVAAGGPVFGDADDRGRGACGRLEGKKGSALYLALEDNKRRLRKRMEKQLAGRGAPNGLELKLSWPRLDEGGSEALEAWLRAHPDALLVVIDTLEKVRQRRGGANVYADDYAALERLLPLAARYRVAIVVVHHLSKREAEDPLDEISGSTGLSGGVDGALILKRERGRADAVLHVIGRDIEDEQELALVWNKATARWGLAGQAEEYRLSGERGEILRVLRGAGSELTPKEIAERVSYDTNPDAVRKLLKKLVEEDEMVKNPGYGKYGYIESSPSSPSGPDSSSDDG